jgi:hypothetical protein
VLAGSPESRRMRMERFTEKRDRTLIAQLYRIGRLSTAPESTHRAGIETPPPPSLAVRVERSEGQTHQAKKYPLWRSCSFGCHPPSRRVERSEGRSNGESRCSLRRSGSHSHRQRKPSPRYARLSQGESDETS